MTKTQAALIGRVGGVAVALGFGAAIGTAVAAPACASPRDSLVTGRSMFTENSIYDVHSVDQYDWNKLTGISFNFLRPDNNALRVAWRYNLADNDFEIAPYYNVDLARILPNEQTEVIRVPIGESFDFTVDYSGITLTYGSQTLFKPIPADLRTNQLTAFRVQPWFGGTSLPPNTLSLYLKLDHRFVGCSRPDEAGEAVVDGHQ